MPQNSFRKKQQPVGRSAKRRRTVRLVKALGLAHHWQRLLDEGRFKTLSEIAAAEQIDKGQARRIARLPQLAPDIIETCLSGKPCEWTLEPLIRQAISRDWEVQRQLIRSTV